MNVYHDEGLLATPYGTFALAALMRGDPEYRGTDIHGRSGGQLTTPLWRRIKTTGSRIRRKTNGAK